VPSVIFNDLVMGKSLPDHRRASLATEPELEASSPRE